MVRRFFPFTVELILVVAIVSWFLFNRLSFPNDSATITHFGWGILAVVSAGWGTCYLAMSRKANSLLNIRHSRNLLTIAVSSGMVVIGILVVNVVAVLSNPIVIDVRLEYPKRDELISQGTAAIVGDASNGKKWFGMSCSSCHGPTGDGVTGAAPSLHTSDFLKTAGDKDIVALIRNGRAANDPNNKTGKIMPAKGGNPFLDEPKIADLVAFLQNLDAYLGSATQSATALNATDRSEPSAAMTNQPAPIIREWKMEDFAGMEISPNEESFVLGMQAFVKASCNKCHMASVAGQELGPTLDKIVQKYTREQLLKHMVEPSDEINERFQTHTFLLLDGRMITGVIVSESEDKIELMTDLLKPEELESILLDDIDDRVKSKISAMPTGLLNTLTKQEIAGLVSYVDATGHQLAATNVPQPNRLEVQEASVEQRPTPLPTSVPSQSFSVTTRFRGNDRYIASFSWLFAVTTGVVLIHFLWITGAASATILHRELRLTSRTQVRLARQTWVLWSIGIAWLTLWFLLFFLIG